MPLGPHSWRPHQRLPGTTRLLGPLSPGGREEALGRRAVSTWPGCEDLGRRPLAETLLEPHGSAGRSLSSHPDLGLLPAQAEGWMGRIWASQGAARRDESSAASSGTARPQCPVPVGFTPRSRAERSFKK